MRGGKDYDADFRNRMHGEGVWADLIRQRFEKTASRLGLNLHAQNFRSLDITGFRRPIQGAARGKIEAPGSQLSLF
jgi:hypothetical protein